MQEKKPIICPRLAELNTNEERKKNFEIGVEAFQNPVVDLF